ncbi:hypothetical protein ACWFMI_19825 [Nocardiopsis terrae]
MKWGKVTKKPEEGSQPSSSGKGKKGGWGTAALALGVYMARSQAFRALLKELAPVDWIEELLGIGDSEEGERMKGPEGEDKENPGGGADS